MGHEIPALPPPRDVFLSSAFWKMNLRQQEDIHQDLATYYSTLESEPRNPLGWLQGIKETQSSLPTTCPHPHLPGCPRAGAGRQHREEVLLPPALEIHDLLLQRQQLLR